MRESDTVVSVQNLTVRYPVRGSWFERIFNNRKHVKIEPSGITENTESIAKGRKQTAVSEVSFDIVKGEILGLLGESGCGKSSLAKAICGLAKDTEGIIEKETRRIQMVFQDPYDALNPMMSIERILEEPLRIMGIKDADIRQRRIRECIAEVDLEEELLSRYPHELSGGQRQRVCIACCLLSEPDLLIADEPVSALDVTVAVQILALLEKLNRTKNLTILFISHDLRAVYRLCDRVMVMRYGRLVETGDVNEVYSNPKAEYTKQLLSHYEKL